MTIYKGDLQKKQLEFKPQIEENESYDMGYKQDTASDVELINKRISEKSADTVNTVKRLSLEEKKQIEILFKLGEGQTYQDRNGNSIPYERKKKVIGTRQETISEYRARVRSIIEDEYRRLKHEATLELNTLEVRREYYENDKIVNKVELRQVEKSFSSNRRNMVKQGLIQMAKADLKTFKEDDEAEQAFKSFLEMLISYGQENSDYSAERIGPGMYREYTQNRDKEIESFINVRQSLDLAIQKAGQNKNLLKTLKGYRKMLRGLADGNLQVPKGVEQIKVRGEIFNKEGKATENSKDFSDSPLFAHEPTIQDVNQGCVGDCYLIGTLSSLIAIDPQIIKDSIKDNGNGTVTVRFFMPSLDVDSVETKYQSEPVYFNVPKKSIGTLGVRNALWASAFELAFNGYRRQRIIRKESIYDLAKHLKGNDAIEFANEIKRVEKKLDEKIKALVPGADESSYKYFIQSSLVISLEKYIRNKPYRDIYNQIVDKKMQEEEAANINSDEISGGKCTEVLEAFSGKLHAASFINDGTTMKQKNNLSYVFDNMPKEKEEKEKSAQELAVQKISENLVRKYLKDFSVDKENRLPVNEEQDKKKDKKKGDKEQKKKAPRYTGYMTRKQMEVLVDKAKGAFVKNETMQQLLSKITDKDPDYQEYMKLISNDPDVAERIARSAEEKILYFFDNAEKNTALNYERFSGKYSGKAEAVFESIKKAAAERKVIVSTTYIELEAQGMERGQSGEPMFEGIASKHAYSVLGTKTYVDENGITQKFVRVRNPWGISHTVYEKDSDTGKIITKQDMRDTTGGINEIELNHFMERFSTLRITGMGTVKPLAV